jgi:GxxExxY protein
MAGIMGEKFPASSTRDRFGFEQEGTKGTENRIEVPPFPRFSPVQEGGQMHPLFAKADKLTGSIIAGAIEVHRDKGPGLIESIYERCLMRELELRNLTAVNQQTVRIEYKGLVFDEPLRFDVLVEESVLVEVKAVRELLPIHQAQLLSYMKLLNVPIGLLINFHELKLTDGVKRMMLPGANR